MKRTIKEWQKVVDELNIRGERLLWELRVVLLQCPSEYREKFAFSAPKSHIFSSAGGLTNNGSSGLPSGMSGVGKVENHSQNPYPSKPDESRGWITKNGRHIFIGDSGTSGGGGVDKSGESGIINYAKTVDHSVDGTPKVYHVSVEKVFEELEKSQVGRDAADYLDKNGIKPKFIYKAQSHTNRGMQNGNNIILYMDNIDTPLIAAQTLIHEVCHIKYGICQSQWAETVCFAKEKMHKENRTYLTIAEKRKLVKLAKDNYGEFQWRKGGQVGGKWV